MKRLFLILPILIFFAPAGPAGAFQISNSNILLQVEQNGEAWYIYPPTGERYFLGRPIDAFQIMRKLGLGATHEFISQSIFPNRVAGRILLDVEQNGEAYYIYPRDHKKYYLGRPGDAFLIMRELSLGITNADLAKIPQANSAVINTAAEKILDMPFTAQAPFGDWADHRQQDGCEEASALMAVAWARGENFTLTEALDEILALAAFQNERFGQGVDTSAADTLIRIINGYFDFYNAELREDVTLADVRTAVNQGHVVLAPTNGRALKNPHFTAPGPQEHMLVIRGYDAASDEFITNDPGTRFGEGFRYPAARLYDAIRDYPTGDHLPITGVEKNMIVVKK